MASPTQITERRRKTKTRRANRSRKSAIARKGSTPPFPIHVAPADESAKGK